VERDVYNGSDLDSSDFNIKIIGDVEKSNETPNLDKSIFNNAYKNALQTYVDSNDCPNIAKP
jgi:hypothetical protein